MADRLTDDEIAAIRDAVHNGTPNAANLIDANTKAGQYWAHARSLLAHAAALESEIANLRNPWQHIDTNEPPAMVDLIVTDGKRHYLAPAQADEWMGRPMWRLDRYHYDQHQFPFWMQAPAPPKEAAR